MSTRKYATIGPIGTKLGTFLINDDLETANKYVSIAQYDKYLIESITIGMKWLTSKIEENGIDKKFLILYNRFQKQINDGDITDQLNQNIIEICYNLSSKLNKIERSSLTSSKEIKSKINIHAVPKSNHLGPMQLSDITEKDIDLSRGLMTQSGVGKYDLYLYVKHQDHYDILPYEYIIDKVKILPNLLFNGYKIN